MALLAARLLPPFKGLPVSPGYPLTGDQVHDSFLELGQLHHISAQREVKYRLDLFQK